jgi:hypothetical protein
VGEDDKVMLRVVDEPPPSPKKAAAPTEAD